MVKQFFILSLFLFSALFSFLGVLWIFKNGFKADLFSFKCIGVGLMLNFFGKYIYNEGE